MLQWDVNKWYEGGDDMLFHMERDRLEKQGKEFIKTYKQIFHTFHTYEDFSGFYHDYEAIIGEFQKLQYFLTLVMTLDMSRDDVMREYQEVERIYHDMISDLEAIYFECDEDFVSNAESLAQAHRGEPYMYALAQWCRDIRRVMRAEDEGYDSIVMDIAETEREYMELYQLYRNSEITETVYQDWALSRYFTLLEMRADAADMLGYQSIFEEKMDAAHMDVCALDACFRVVEASKWQKNADKHEASWTSTPSTPDESIHIALSALSEWGFQDMKHFFEYMLESRRIDMDLSVNKRPQNITFCIHEMGEYISLNPSYTAEDRGLLLHELWHAYYGKQSQGQKKIEYTASVFSSEVAAAFGECILENFYKSEKYEKTYFSEFKELQRNFSERMELSYGVTQVERLIETEYLKGNITSVDDIQWILDQRPYGITAWEFLSIPQVFIHPYYMASYVFALLMGKYLFTRWDAETFTRFCSFGGAHSVVDIFREVGVDILDERVYSEAIALLYHNT